MLSNIVFYQVFVYKHTLSMTNLTTHMGEDHEWTNLLQDMAQHIGGLPSIIQRDIFEYLGAGMILFIIFLISNKF